MKTKNITTIVVGPRENLNFNITMDNIYVGKIMQCKSYYSEAEKLCKLGVIGFSGCDGKEIESDFVKNAILVKINCKYLNLFIELDKFDVEELKKRIKIRENGTANIFIEDDEFIMLDEPFETGMKFVDPNSIRKFEYKKGVSTGNSSKQNEKVKQFVRIRTRKY